PMLNLSCKKQIRCFTKTRKERVPGVLDEKQLCQRLSMIVYCEYCTRLLTIEVEIHAQSVYVVPFIPKWTSPITSNPHYAAN
ncbi:MAG: hypothetical protein ABSE05_04835, partial [Syntrophales bacterium]